MAVNNPDLDVARSRFINATNRFVSGARLQRDRIVGAAAAAPRLLPGSQYEVADLTSVPSNDLDYYVYELARIQDVAREVIKVFDSPPDVLRALADFDAAVPRLREARNPLTHASNDDRLDEFAWFSALTRLKADGGVEYLIDPRYSHHDAAETLAASLLDYLRTGLRQP